MTIEEIKSKLEPKFKNKTIHSFDRSIIKPNVFILIFKDGSQTNVEDIYFEKENEEI